MDDRGRIICGKHGQPWCQLCSDEERERLRRIREVVEPGEVGVQTPIVETDEERLERVRRELASLGLGKRARP